MLSRRYLILLAAVGATVCLGATYSWSVFVTPLRELNGIGQGAAQIPYNTFYVSFPLTLIVAGALLARLGPRRLMVLGALFFGGGWMLAGLGRVHFGFVIAGIGVLGGIGVGLAYIVPIATCILWFPRHKGLITGVAVAGFGGGAMLITELAGRLMRAPQGWAPYDVFATLGVVFMGVLAAAGLAMANPPDHHPISGTVTETPANPAFRSRDVLAQPVFWLLYLAMFTGLVAGLAVNANMKQLYSGPEAGAGLRAVQFFALANAAGRILWGFIFDRTRASAAIRLNLAVQAAVLLSAGALLRSPAGLWTFAVLTGLSYGGVLVIYASTTARLWGPKRIGPVYSLLFSANIPASFAPVVVGRVYDLRYSFILPLAVIGVLLLVAAAAVRVKEPAAEPAHTVLPAVNKTA